MTNIQFRKYVLSVAAFLVAIKGIASSIEYKIGVPVTNTTIWWIVQSIILCLFFYAKVKFCDKKQAELMVTIRVYLVWTSLSLFHGLFIAETYWDWKGLIVNTMSLLIPSVAYAATSKKNMASILSFFKQYGLPFFGIVIFITFPVGYGYYLALITVLLIFISAIPKQWKLIILGLAFAVILADLSARSNIIKFIVPLCFGLMYYLRTYLSLKILKTTRIVLLSLPLVLFLLAATGTFNIFNMAEYINGEHSFVGLGYDGSIKEQNLILDTRTFIYVENINSALKYDYWLVGRSPARGYDSIWFGHEDMNGRGERIGSEVSLLNIFTWSGLIGVGLYFLIFYQATKLAVNKSNNIFSKLLGLFVAFRWAYAWVEDFVNFNMFYFSLWLMIGMCFSESFRKMTNAEVKDWISEIFKQRKIKW